MLATNVAETSLTVPGIRYVVDPGTARISRYSTRTQGAAAADRAGLAGQSANQRAGRCGRVGDGICIRLYSEDDFDARPAFTEPEILRTNLASVHPADDRRCELGELGDFPFVEPPDAARGAATALALLHELGALEPGQGPHGSPTSAGQLAALPVDPRLAGCCVEADRTGCLREVLVIAAALSVQDPRERPDRAAPGGRREARPVHRTGRLGLPRPSSTCGTTSPSSARSCPATGSGGCCRDEFLHYLRIREWQDLHAQLRSAARTAGMTLQRRRRRRRTGSTPPCSPGCCRRSACGSGGDAGEYLGARGAKFVIFPGSPLARRSRRAG